MIPFAYHYRRRHLHGITAIGTMSGTVLAQRDDTQIGVFDYLLAGPIFTEPVSGRRGTTTVTIARPAPIAARLWLWPDRPLRLLQFFNSSSTTTIYRVDFATYPQRREHIIYQTDLYLDLFATPDEDEYAILDEDELSVAHARGLITSEMSSAILAQADWLADLLEGRRLGAWLASYCAVPFDMAALGQQLAWEYHDYAPDESDGWPKE